MVTVNKRAGVIQAVTVNGITPGGTLRADIECGFDNKIQSVADGLEVPIKDQEVQFCRGKVVSQDWSLAIDLLTGTVGTLVFYERKSGTVVATGFVEHTINGPVIHLINFNIRKGLYSPVTYNFECRAADETKGFADMWVPLDDQAAPTYISADRGGYRVVSAALGAIDLLHTTGLDFTIKMPLAKECNDSDVGYTCVDARSSGITARGSISCQDMSVATATLLSQRLLAAARGDLVITVVQGSGAANKVITIAGVKFESSSRAYDNSDPKSFIETRHNFEVTNDTTTQLTLSGANKIITIA